MSTKKPTVYLSVSRGCVTGICDEDCEDCDIIERMSLHPIHDDVSCGEQDIDRVTWPFRVVWSEPSNPFGYDVVRWAVSCRGAGFGTKRDPQCIYFVTPSGVELGWPNAAPGEGEDVDAVAIAWLLAGERKRKTTT